MSSHDFQDDQNPTAYAKELRLKAEKILQESAQHIKDYNAKQIEQLIHELQVHQVELEIQNKTLQDAHRELGYTRDQYLQLYNSAPVGYLTSDAFGVVLQVNLTLETMLGVSPEELLNAPLGKWCTDKDAYYLHCRALIRTQDNASCEMEMKRADGTIFYAYVESCVIDNNQSDIIPCIRSIIMDVTDKKLMEQELIQLNSNLEKQVAKEMATVRRQETIIYEQKKLADMGQMINAIAHQWRQPLNALSLYAQIIVDRIQNHELTPEFVNRFSDTHRQLITHLSETIDDFRNFFHPDKEKIQFDGILVIVGLLRLLQIQFNAHQIDIDVHCSCNNKTKECDNLLTNPECKFKKTKLFGYPGEFKQVIINLLYNAADAIRENMESGRIKRGLIHVDVEGLTDSIWMTIADNGGGIPDDTMSHIYEPYFSTKEEGKGTGLGLYMTKLIVEEHMQGKLSAENRGDGAAFKIELAVFAPDAP